jgi:hypothetical protein
MANDQDINFRFAAEGVDQTVREQEKLTRGLAGMGREEDKAAAESRKSAAAMRDKARAMDDAEKKANPLTNVLSGLKQQIIGIGAAWLGWMGFEKLLDKLIERFQKLNQAVKELNDRSLGILNVGQALEFQTGTVGKQKEWAIQAAEVQKAGALGDINTAKDMMISADIAFAPFGGIKDQKNVELLKSVAPFVGAAQMSGPEVARMFDFAQTANVAPNREGWQDYFAKLQAAYTASKSTSFGEFMTGLQKGLTPYMASGGTFEEGLSTFAGARAVTSSEALAASLLEQISRISGGAYEKPRKAMEKAMGVDWSHLSMDQRKDTLLRYVGQLPESQRSQFMAEAGFAPELINQVGRLVTPAAQETIAATRQKVAAADTVTVDAQTAAWLASPLGQKFITEAEKSIIDLTVGTQYTGSQNNLDLAARQYQAVRALGADDIRISEDVEPTYIALGNLADRLEKMGKAPAPEVEAWRQKLLTSVNRWRGNMEVGTTMFVPDEAMIVSYRKLYMEYEEMLKSYGLEDPAMLGGSDDYSYEPAAAAKRPGRRSGARDAYGETFLNPGATIINNHYDMSRTIKIKDPGSEPRGPGPGM